MTELQKIILGCAIVMAGWLIYVGISLYKWVKKKKDKGVK